ncbi:hypothetical protein [Thiocapsa imhoffii]|uniref:hypothetical protein n=1 Tax=Thiocapsa imhoffii TaxID=382777 RepID=UPI0019065F08|nr:hypothetical protein [Thiocapsa imhoffii]
MNYAIKRTWPDQPKSWESKGEAETAEAFALAFATDQGLGLGTQVLVMEMTAEGGEVEFFKVANTSPYQLLAVQPGTTGVAEPAPATTPATAANAPSSEVEEPIAVPSLRPFGTMIFYMAKVGIIAVVVIGSLGMLIKYLRA